MKKKKESNLSKQQMRKRQRARESKRKRIKHENVEQFQVGGWVWEKGEKKREIGEYSKTAKMHMIKRTNQP